MENLPRMEFTNGSQNNKDMNKKDKIDLSVNFAGIKAPNPFWLASAPPTNSGYQIMKAFDAGWGGSQCCSTCHILPRYYRKDFFFL